jgi:hypothetical protein
VIILRLATELAEGFLAGSDKFCARQGSDHCPRSGLKDFRLCVECAQAGFRHEVRLSTIRPNWRPSTPPRFGWLGACVVVGTALRVGPPGKALCQRTKIMAKARDFIHFLIDYDGAPRKARVTVAALLRKERLKCRDVSHDQLIELFIKYHEQIEAIALSKMRRGDFSGDGATVSTEDLTA